MKKLFLLLPLFCLIVSCKGASEKYADAEIARIQPLLDEVHSAAQQCKKNISADNIAYLDRLCSNPEIDLKYGNVALRDEDKARLKRWQGEIDSLRIRVSQLQEEYVKDYYKVLVNEDVLVESIKTYPVYLKKGSTLIVGYSPSGPMMAKLYNADSKSLVKIYKNAAEDTLKINFSAVYLFEMESKEPQYAKVELFQKVDDFNEFLKDYKINVEQVEVPAGSFRAQKVPGIKMTPIFEEPHKYTLRSRMKYIWDNVNSNRSIVAMKVPSGASDILYHVRISTADSEHSSDGEFFNDVYTKYRKIKFMGLPLYESTSTHNALFRELLNSLTIKREENAYCNLYVFTSAAQAKKFQDNVNISKLSYDIDNSALGTQSRNERIHLKPGTGTIYLGFENTRQRYDVYLWVEALASVRNDIYYTEFYKLSGEL